MRGAVGELSFSGPTVLGFGPAQDSDTGSCCHYPIRPPKLTIGLEVILVACDEPHTKTCVLDSLEIKLWEDFGPVSDIKPYCHNLSDCETGRLYLAREVLGR